MKSNENQTPATEPASLEDDARKPKSRTELALRKRREAYQDRASHSPLFSSRLEREATELLALDQPSEVGRGGEVVRRQVIGLPFHQVEIRNTLADEANQVAEDASIRRTDLLMQSGFDVVAMAVDAAESIEARNSLEKMLAHQMGVAHEVAMRFANRALDVERGAVHEQVEACRLANASARLMKTFQEGLLTLHKIRNNGSQTVTVQHVNVESGAHAVIGSVQTGGAKGRGNDEEKG